MVYLNHKFADTLSLEIARKPKMAVINYSSNTRDITMGNKVHKVLRTLDSLFSGGTKVFLENGRGHNGIWRWRPLHSEIKLLKEGATMLYPAICTCTYKSQ